jgi:DNA-directed RNA polymerase specialized sigma24 family protein
MRETTRTQRNAIRLAPTGLDGVEESRGLWFESREEVEQGLDWGRRKAGLMQWLRRHMEHRLTPRERRCLELHFLEELPYTLVAERERCSTSSAHRAVARALHKLRAAAEEEPSWRVFARGGRRPPR